MGIFSVFSTALVPGFSQSTTYKELHLFFCTCREVRFLLHLGTGSGK